MGVKRVRNEGGSAHLREELFIVPNCDHSRENKVVVIFLCISFEFQREENIHNYHEC